MWHAKTQLLALVQTCRRVTETAPRIILCHGRFTTSVTVLLLPVWRTRMYWFASV